MLAWAADAGRILLTHDEKTIPIHAYGRLAAGQTFAGVIVASADLAIGKVIDDILLIVHCSSSPEWINQLQRLPL